MYALTFHHRKNLTDMTTTSSAVATTVVVNPVELIKQVIENIHAQLQPLEFEIGNASQGDSSYVRKVFLGIELRSIYYATHLLRFFLLGESIV